MIHVENVTKYYGSHCAVQNLSFNINEGECVGFLGLNGAGKSTTLRLLSCLLLPTSGRVQVRGIDAEENPHEIRKLIGYLPDTPPVYAEMTVHEYLVFAAKLRGMSHADTFRRLAEVVEICSLQEVTRKPIANLSHGYQQRVGIAQAIIHNPALLILDEPIQGLDPVQIVEMREMIRGLRGKHTIVLSTHILSEIEQTCDRILMIHEGRIAAEGTEEDLATRYASGHAVELEVRGSEAAVRSALGSISGLQNLQVEPLHGAGGELLRVRCGCSHDPREQISRAIVQGNLGLLALRSTSSGLESIFLRLSRSEASSSNAGQLQSASKTKPHKTSETVQ
jgi:ABC-2 type transport system ATP-binding protein